MCVSHKQTRHAIKQEKSGHMSRPYPCLGEERGRDTELGLFNLFSDIGGPISYIYCDAPKSGVPLTTRQSAENLYVSYLETHT